MNEWQYTTIVSALNAGVPALANVLITALNNVLQENEDLKKEKEENTEEK